MELLGGNSMGGCTKINAMLYTRGLPAEYNSWVESGCQGWSYDDMEPYFIKSETDLDHKDSTGLANEYHGTSGKDQSTSLLTFPTRIHKISVQVNGRIAHINRPSGSTVQSECSRRLMDAPLLTTYEES